MIKDRDTSIGLGVIPTTSWTLVSYQRDLPSGMNADRRTKKYVEVLKKMKTTSRVMKTDKQRLLDKTIQSGDCWLWTASVSYGGYGHFKYQGKSDYAHQVSYMIFIGSLIPGDVVRHSCDNPGCVNPNHLLKGTHNDNVQDRVARKRSAKGFGNGRSKLTSEIVKRCRRSDKSYKELAKEYGVSGSTMRRACVGLTWK